MPDETTIVGVEPSPTTAFQRVRELCDKNGCDPIFRAETLDGEVHFSLSAIQRTDQRRVYDLRQSAPWDDASRDAEDMAQQAEKDWWS